MEIDMTTLRTRDAYALLTSVIIPRPIAWVSTQDKAGHCNLAPFSYFSGLASDPPLVTLGIANLRDGTLKDTLRIARQSGVLCINVVEDVLVAKMNESSAEFPSHVSEFDACGLTPVACTAIPCVRVGESRVALECRLLDVHSYGNGAGVNLVVAEVIHAFIADEICDENHVEAGQLHAIGRLGGTAYAKMGETFHLPRPKM